jgi:glutamate receptor, ionotropic, plant
MKHYSDVEPEVASQSSRSARLQTFLSFVDEKEDSVKARSKRRQLDVSTKSMDDASKNSSKRYRTDTSSKRIDSFGSTA